LTRYASGCLRWAPEHQIEARELIADLERRIALLADVVAQPPPGEERPE
jgi:hypothetical protein